MIRCDTEAERKALADFVWAAKDVLVARKTRCPATQELARAFNKLFNVCELLDLSESRDSA